MGTWQINADTLAGSRFVVSPLAETISALNALERARPEHPGERTWLDTHLPAYRARQTADPVAALLVPAALGGSWNADFITPTPTGEGTPAFEQELAPVRSTSPERARSDLVVSLGGSPLPRSWTATTWHGAPPTSWTGSGGTPCCRTGRAAAGSSRRTSSRGPDS